MPAVVVLNARDGGKRAGRESEADRLTGAERAGDHWRITLDGDGTDEVVEAGGVVDAGGP